MKKLLIGLTAMILLIVAGSVFYACKKDRFDDGRSEKNQLMSMGNYSQPTQNIVIPTFIDIGTTQYTVTGNAVVGSYNGQIYECNLSWTMAVGTYTGYEMAFEAVLKPEYDNLAVVSNVLQHYDITINGQPITETSEYSETVGNEVITITPAEIAALWNSVVVYCEEHVVITPFDYSKPYTSLQNKYIDLIIAYEYAKQNKNYNPDEFSYEEKLDIIHLIDEAKATVTVETAADIYFYTFLMNQLMTEINSHPCIQTFVNNFAVEYDANDMIIYTGYSDCYDAISKFQILKYYEYGFDIIAYYTERNNLTGEEEWGLPPLDIDLVGNPKQKAVQYTLHWKWDKNTVEYMWNGTSSTVKSYTLSAMADWKAASNNKLKFSEITKSVNWNKTLWCIGCKYFVRISSVSTNNYSGQSTIGRVPWADLKFNTTGSYAASYPRVYQHELGHVLGLYHEHQRPDRDTYITYNSSNVDGCNGVQFTKMTAGSYNYHGSTFDFNSIMLYGSSTYAKTGKYTLTKKDGTTWISPSPISATDKNVIQRIYN